MLRDVVVAVSVVVVVVGLVVKTVYFPSTKPLTETMDPQYDYIVVGAGSAGCVVASRLSEDPDTRVLLLEAGGDDQGDYTMSIPFYWYENFASTRANWAFYTQPQKYSSFAHDGQRSFWPRGKVLGGSSNLNSMVYMRGSRHDYDNWAQGGATGWSYREVLPYFLKSEDMQNPELQESKYHGTGGPLKVESKKSVPLTDVLLQAGQELGHHLVDFNGAVMSGIGKVQVTQGSGVRFSTSRAFIHPHLYRPNLHVVTHAHVNKVLIKDGRATGVEVNHKGKVQEVKAKKEVIVSAGAVGSPQILMLSGVGRKEHLEKMGITMHADLPVGDNLQDHLFLDYGIAINSSDGITAEKEGSWTEYFKYILYGEGVLRAPANMEAIVFFGTTEELRKKDFPDVEIFLFARPLDWPALIKFTPEEQSRQRGRGEALGISCMPNLLRPASVGILRLQFPRPQDPPVIDPQYLTRDEDVDVLLQGIRDCQRLMTTPALRAVDAKPLDGPVTACSQQHDFDSDQYWRCHIRHTAMTVYHPSCTCKMGDPKDPSTVLDPQLRVKGVKGLRVVDASVMPSIVSGNINAAVIMIAEKAADMIRGQ